MLLEFDRTSYLKGMVKDFVTQLEDYDLITPEEVESRDNQILFSTANAILLDQIEELNLLGEKLGIKQIFHFSNKEIQATPLVDSLTKYADRLIRTSNISIEKFYTEKEVKKKCYNKEKKEYDIIVQNQKVMNYEISQKSPNRRNYVEEQILQALERQQLLLDEIEKFVSNVNQLDEVERTIIYHHYLKLKKESVPKICIKYIDYCSRATAYRLREKAVITLVYDLMGIPA